MAFSFLPLWREAERTGFSIPALDGELDLCARNGAGWPAAALFTWQARKMWAQANLRRNQRQVSAALAESPLLAAEPLWEGLCQALWHLGDDDEGGLALHSLQPTAEQLIAATRDLSHLPQLSIIAERALEGAAEDPLPQQVGECLAWLCHALSALAAALASEQMAAGPVVIGCYGHDGIVWRTVSGNIDVYMVRAFLNDVPTLQASEELVAELPRRDRDWMVCESATITALEASLPQIDTTIAEQPLAEWPAHSWRAQIGEYQLRFAPPIPGGVGEVALGLLGGPCGVTLLEVELHRAEPGVRIEVQPLPLRYAGPQLLERVELLEQRLQALIVDVVLHGRRAIEQAAAVERQRRRATA